MSGNRIERLNRVIWRWKEMQPFSPPDKYSNHQLEIAIGEEFGTDFRTIKSITAALKRHGLIESAGLGLWKIGDNAESRTASGYGDFSGIPKDFDKDKSQEVLQKKESKLWVC